jgi:hypothetical protein
MRTLEQYLRESAERGAVEHVVTVGDSKDMVLFHIYPHPGCGVPRETLPETSSYLTHNRSVVPWQVEDFVTAALLDPGMTAEAKVDWLKVALIPARAADPA